MIFFSIFVLYLCISKNYRNLAHEMHVQQTFSSPIVMKDNIESTSLA